VWRMLNVAPSPCEQPSSEPTIIQQVCSITSMGCLAG